MVRRINRRALLRGLGGVAVGLPALELMGGGTLQSLRGTARAALPPGPPPRFFIAYGGMAIGADNIEDDFMTPTTTGRGYDVRPRAQPIADFDVRDDVSIVSGLKIPWRTGSSVPPGGREADTVHYRVRHITSCGTHTSAEPRGTRPRGPSCDQIIADHIAGDTPHRILPYHVQQSAGGSQSIRQNGDSFTGVDSISNPRVAYESLFTGFVPEGAMVDEAAQRRARLLLRSRRSVLDLVSESTERLVGKLGTTDRQRMELHLDQIRDLETRLDALDEGAMERPSACVVPNSPMSGLDQRGVGEAFSRLIAMAWACDLSRVCALSITETKCYMPMEAIMPGMAGDVHSGSHGGGRRQERLTVAVSWFVEQLARLTRLLRDTPEADGTTLLDHSALTLYFEAGHGYDPDTDTQNRSHSTENMVVLVAGRAGGLKSGQHILGRERHPARVMITAMNAMGVETDQLGEVSGTVPELFG